MYIALVRAIADDESTVRAAVRECAIDIYLAAYDNVLGLVQVIKSCRAISHFVDLNAFLPLIWYVKPRSTLCRLN